MSILILLGTGLSFPWSHSTHTSPWHSTELRSADPSLRMHTHSSPLYQGPKLKEGGRSRWGIFLPQDHHEAIKLNSLGEHRAQGGTHGLWVQSSICAVVLSGKESHFFPLFYEYSLRTQQLMTHRKNSTTFSFLLVARSTFPDR